MTTGLSGSWRLLLALPLLLLLTMPVAMAASDAHRAAAAELLQVLGVDQGVAPIARRLSEGTGLRTLIADVPEDQRPLAETYLQRITDLVASEMSWSALEPEFIDLYAGMFSEAELREITAFFRTPAGRHYLDSTGELNQMASTLLRSRALQLAPRIRAITDEMDSALDLPAAP